MAAISAYETKLGLCNRVRCTKSDPVPTPVPHDHASVRRPVSRCCHSERMTRTASLTRAWVPTAAVTLGAALLVALVAQVPEICPAIDPAPPSCAPDARESVALGWTLVLVATGAIAIAAIYLVPSQGRRRTMSIALTTIAVMSLIAIGATFLASGFVLL